MIICVTSASHRLPLHLSKTQSACCHRRSFAALLRFHAASHQPRWPQYRFTHSVHASISSDSAAGPKPLSRAHSNAHTLFLCIGKRVHSKLLGPFITISIYTWFLCHGSHAHQSGVFTTTYVLNKNKSRMRSSLGRTHVLQSRQLPVHTPPSHQFLVVSLLDNLPLVKDVDNVCVLDRRQAVSNRNRGPAFRRRVERILHHTLRCRVKGRGGFVKEAGMC